MKTSPDRARTLARLSTYIASLLWAVLVLSQSEAVRLSPYVRLITPSNEDIWGGVIGIMAATMLYRLHRGRHSAVGLALHVGITAFWLYTALSIYLSLYTVGLVFPIGGSLVPVIVGLAIFGITDADTERR